jgi:hypothetical protein
MSLETDYWEKSSKEWRKGYNNPYGSTGWTQSERNGQAARNSFDKGNPWSGGSANPYGYGSDSATNDSGRSASGSFFSSRVAGSAMSEPGGSPWTVGKVLGLVIGFLSQGRSSNQNTPAARDFGNDAPVVRDDKDHWVYLRPGASKHNAPLGIVPEGTAVQILRLNGSWFLVQTGDG